MYQHRWLGYDINQGHDISESRMSQPCSYGAEGAWEDHGYGAWDPGWGQKIMQPRVKIMAVHWELFSRLPAAVWWKLHQDNFFDKIAWWSNCATLLNEVSCMDAWHGCGHWCTLEGLFICESRALSGLWHQSCARLSEKGQQHIISLGCNGTPMT
jgi:hypothetical protein